jgi:4-amino-4-deoxy-L-arabinose transferase-like glycosyltransferase
MTTASARDLIKHFIRQPGFILAAINFCLGLVWMTVIQRLDAPDEPAHLQAIMQVRKEHKLPEVHFASGSRPGEIIGSPSDAETRAYILRRRSKLPVNDEYVALPYKSVQPPLYYVAAGLVAHLVSPDPLNVLYVGRLVAILFGAASVYFCWLAIRELAPRAPMWAFASAGVVALLPEFCFTNAHAANDSAVNLAATAAFYVWIRGLRHPEFDRRLFGAGAMLGLAFLCKLTAAVLIPGLALVILFRMFQVRPSVLGWTKWLTRALSMLAGATLGTVLVCGWWFIRNVFTYGEPSGTNAEVRFVAGNFIKADFNDPHTAGNLLRYTLESLWGRFGWNDITLHQAVYHFCNSTALLLILLSILAGIGMLALRVTRKPSRDAASWQASLVFLAVGLTLFVGYVQYNAKIAYQPQARYFFILLLPGALLLTGGVYAFAVRPPLRAAVCTLLLTGLAVLNALGLTTIGKAGIAIGGTRQHVTSRSRSRARRGRAVHFQVAAWSVPSQARSGTG